MDSEIRQRKRWFGPGVRGTIWLVVAAALGFIIVRGIRNPLNYESDMPLAILAFFIMLCVILFVALRSTYRAYVRAWNHFPDPMSPSSFLLKAFFWLGLTGYIFSAEVAAVIDLLTSGEITLLTISDLGLLFLLIAIVSVPALACLGAALQNVELYRQQRRIPKKKL